MRPGETLGGRYELRSRIAGGGMGEVWVAHDAVLDRTVAVKVIRRELAEDPEFARRFHHEARTAARLSHPNIAQVHDFGRDAGTDYLVMEYVRGTSLADLIDRRGGLPPEQVVSLVGQAAAGLEAAHEAGVVHRDVKPANILVTEKGTVKLTDFGIARALGEAKMTRTGEVLGTAQYLAPEAALGHDVDGQADLYALAVVTYEALTGGRPFQADSAVTLAMKHINESPPQLPAHVPSGVRDAVMHGLAKGAYQRPHGVGEYARALRGGLSSTPSRFPVQPTHAPYAGPPSMPPSMPSSMPSSAAQTYRPSSGPRMHGGSAVASHGYGAPYGQPAYGFAPPINRERPADGTAKGIGWAWIIMCVVILASLFMPWASMNGQSWNAFNLEWAELNYNVEPASAGLAEVLLGVTVVLLMLGLPQALGKGHLAWGIVALFVCLLGGLLWAAMMGYVTGTDDEPSPLDAGAGLTFCGIAGLVVFGTAIASLAKRR